MEDTEFKDKIFEFAFECAIRDATSQGAYTGKLDSLNDIKEHMKAKVKQYIEQIFTGENILDPLTVIQDIHDSNELKQFNNGKESKKQFKFGNIQKLVNMTAKYMYIATYTDKNLREGFRNCHCPIDSKICQKIYDKCNEKKIDFEDSEYFPEAYKNSRKKIRTFFYTMSFSKISEKDYKYCQEIVNKYCKDEDLYPIEFDYKYWDKPLTEENKNKILD